MLVILGEKCHYCQKFRGPAEVIDWPGGVRICVGCIQRHESALFSLSTGTPPKECSECGKEWEELRHLQPPGDIGGVKMACHFENGLYRFLCVTCDHDYTRKRADLYRETQFGQEIKL